MRVLPPPQPIRSVPERGQTIQERFETFHLYNPWVYESLLSMTRELADRGRQKVGIGMLTEVLRWEVWRTTDDPATDFKLSNDYRSRYARKIMEENPDLRGIFDLRPLRSP